jgi:hypothetical protein
MTRATLLPPKIHIITISCHRTTSLRHPQHGKNNNKMKNGLLELTQTLTATGSSSSSCSSDDNDSTSKSGNNNNIYNNNNKEQWEEEEEEKEEKRNATPMVEDVPTDEPTTWHGSKRGLLASYFFRQT